MLLQQENEQLKRRIEQLNNRIKILIRDKERLLEISNHLRSQLHRYESKLICIFIRFYLSIENVVIDEPKMIKRPPVADTIPTNIRSNIPKSPKRDPNNLDNKLQRLEQLQYALTKQVNHFF